ncbi:MAG: hypothetical protein ACRBB6_03730 [Neptuniibacter sp.]
MPTAQEKEALLAEIQHAITAINNVWPLLDRKDPVEFKKRQKLLAEKRKLVDQFDEVLDDLMNDTPDEITAALADLQAATTKAKEAKESIENDIAKIEKVTNAITKAVKAVSSVAAVLA